MSLNKYISIRFFKTCRYFLFDSSFIVVSLSRFYKFFFIRLGLLG